jgi:hypothetical protein
MELEFFLDPICPWAWLTSRWVVEVSRQRDLNIWWRFICLRMVNAEREMEAAHVARHTMGQKLLRVAAAVRDAEGNDRAGEVYTQVGGDLHVRKRGDEMRGELEAGFPGYLGSIGLGAYAASANDERWDSILREETELALSRTGRDVGTPIISFTRNGVSSSVFGPVISRVPRGAEALRLWDAVSEVATFPGLAEIKRSLRERPQVEDSLG